jgi:hypothetical protein
MYLNGLPGAGAQVGCHCVRLEVYLFNISSLRMTYICSPHLPEERHAHRQRSEAAVRC